MSFYGIIIGMSSFIIIGALHPIVIKAEYYLGKKCWPLFAVSGAICCVLSVTTEQISASIILGVLAFSLFWAIHELFEQEERVNKGWYPKNERKPQQNVVRLEKIVK